MTMNQTKTTVCRFSPPSQSVVQLLCEEIFTDTVCVQSTISEFLTQKKIQEKEVINVQRQKKIVSFPKRFS